MNHANLLRTIQSLQSTTPEAFNMSSWTNAGNEEPDCQTTACMLGTLANDPNIPEIYWSQFPLEYPSRARLVPTGDYGHTGFRALASFLEIPPQVAANLCGVGGAWKFYGRSLLQVTIEDVIKKLEELK